MPAFKMYKLQQCMFVSKLKLNPDEAKSIVFGSKAQHLKLSSHFPVTILGSLLQPATHQDLGVWFDVDFSFSEHVQNTCKGCFLQIHDLRRIRQYIKKWLSLLQMSWLVVIETMVTLFEVFHVSISISCRVFRILLLGLSQVIESIFIVHLS